MNPNRQIRRLLATIAAVGAGIAPAAVGTPVASAHGRVAAPTAHASVIGGHPASIAEVPWLAFIEGEGSEGAYSCTGTVVAPRVVLTAGHCVFDLETLTAESPSTYAVTTGVADHTAARTANVSSVAKTVVFPQINFITGHGDAGLLILSTPVSAPALPLASAGDAALAEGGTPLLLAGWGLTDPAATKVPDVLRSGTSMTQAPGYCRRRSREYEPFYSPAREICAVDTPSFAVGGCFGDSGGPAIAHRADGTPVEVGVVTTGGPECSRRVPNIFTRVDRISTWVSGWIAAVEQGAPVPTTPPARPPLLTAFEAENLSDLGLARDFPIQIPALIQTRCTRLAKQKAKCRATWQQGGNDFYGNVIVFYAVEDNTVVWKDHYVIHRVSHRCRLRSAHPRTCPVHTRRR